MRKTFSIYRIDTGEIVKIFTGNESDLPLNIPGGCAAVEGRHSDVEFHIVDGKPQRKPAPPFDPEREKRDALAVIERGILDRARGVFDPIVFVKGERARRAGKMNDPAIAAAEAMEASLLALDEELQDARTRVAKVRSRKALKSILEGEHNA